MQVIPGELLGAILHGEQDFHYHRPIEPGMTLSTTAAPIGMRQRSSGVTVVTRAETREAGGELVVEQYMTTFVRGAQGVEDVGDEAPPASLRRGAARARARRRGRPDLRRRPDLPLRRGLRRPDADPPRRRVREGGRAARGSSSTASAPWPSPRWRLIGARVPRRPDPPASASPCASPSIALPEQTITTRIWDTDGGYAYETTSDAGAVVIKDGLGRGIDAAPRGRPPGSAANPVRAQRRDPRAAARRDDRVPDLRRLRGHHDPPGDRARRRLAGRPEPPLPAPRRPRRRAPSSGSPSSASPTTASAPASSRPIARPGSGPCSTCSGRTSRARCSPSR